MALCKRDGTACLKGEWRKEIRRSDRVVGFEIYSVGGEPLSVFARFSGISHGEEGGKALAYEVGITGNPENRDHRDWHGRLERSSSREECLADFEKIVGELKTAGASLARLDGG